MLRIPPEFWRHFGNAVEASGTSPWSRGPFIEACDFHGRADDEEHEETGCGLKPQIKKALHYAHRP